MGDSHTGQGSACLASSPLLLSSSSSSLSPVSEQATQPSLTLQEEKKKIKNKIKYWSPLRCLPLCCHLKSEEEAHVGGRTFEFIFNLVKTRDRAPVGFTGNPQIKSRSLLWAEVRSTTEHSRVHVAAAGKSITTNNIQSSQPLQQPVYVLTPLDIYN